MDANLSAAQFGGSTASSPQWPAEWDEDAHNQHWGQHDMAEVGQPHPVTRFKTSYGVGMRRPLDNE